MEKDREMTEYMDSFESSKAAILEEIKQVETTIVGLLEHISAVCHYYSTVAT